MDKVEFEVTLPTEQYGNIKARFNGKPEDAVNYYLQLRQEWLNTKREGCDPKQWRRILDTYLEKGTMHPEDYELLGDYQRLVISEIRKSINRNK